MKGLTLATGASPKRPIKEIVLDVIQSEINPGETFGLSRLDAAIDGLTRRQITTALHSLSEHGLNGQLENVGKGLWSYQPIGAPMREWLSDDASVDYDVESTEEGIVDLPLGWRTQITVISKAVDTTGATYVCQTDEGTLLRVIPYIRVRSL